MLARALAARLFYVAVVLFATVAELHATSDLAAAGRRLARALHPTLTARDVVDGLRNVLLFAGFGATWVATAAEGRWRRAALPATVSGFALSACVEAAQLFSPVRTASLVDVATNTLGTLAGAWLTALVIVTVRSRRAARSYLGVPAFVFGVSYLLAALAGQLAGVVRRARSDG